MPDKEVKVSSLPRPSELDPNTDEEEIIETSHKPKRRLAREIAMQAIFQVDFISESDNSPSIPDEILSLPWAYDMYSGKIDKKIKNYAVEIIKGTTSHLRRIDSLIEEELEHWRIDRLKKVDKAVLRISVYSLVYQRELSPAVVINEAIEIVREFSGGDSPSFVNGILDAVKERIYFEGV